MFRRLAVLGGLIAALAFCPPALGDSGKRIALIIGNTHYQDIGQVTNAVGDARLVRDRLVKLGFRPEDIVERENVDHATMAKLVVEFKRRAGEASSALFYFAGHGKGDARGDAWILPVDASLEAEEDLPFVAVKLDDVMNALRLAKGHGVRLVLVDACRDVSRKRGGGFTLKEDSAPEGVLAQTSTRADETADDGPVGGHSPYATALAEVLNDNYAGTVDVRELLTRVSKRVRELTSNRQSPVIVENIEYDLKIAITGDVIGQKQQISSGSGFSQQPSNEPQVWDVVAQQNTAQGYDVYLAIFPTGSHATDAQARLSRMRSVAASMPAPQSVDRLQLAREAVNSITEDDWNNRGPTAIAVKVLAKARATEVLALADTGDAKAQLIAGLLYFEGLDGVPRDSQRAVRFFTLSSDQGYSWAKAALAAMYIAGTGVKQNPHQGIVILRQAADLDNSYAEAALAVMYSLGQWGLEQNDAEAERYARLAAAHNTPIADVALGLLYVKGTGSIKQNPTEGMRLFKRAADAGNAEAQGLLGALYMQGFPAFGLPQDEREAVRLLKLASDQGVEAARSYLAMMYIDGRGGLSKDVPGGIRMLKLAAENGASNAKYLLGALYLLGKIGVPQDQKEGMRLISEAAQQGDVDAQKALAAAYMNGTAGMPKDDREAVIYLKLAASQLNSEAEAALGLMFFHGRGGLEQNRKEAVRLWKAAVDQGQASAEAFLGLVYLIGEGGEARNQDEGVRLIRHSAEQGDARGQIMLSELYRQGSAGVAKNESEADRLLALAKSQSSEKDFIEGRERLRKAIATGVWD